MKTKLKLLASILFTFTALNLQGGIKFGVIPLESAEIMHQQFTPLTQYLSQEIGVPVELVIGANYQATMSAIGDNTVQFAYLTPTTFPKAKKQYPDAGITPIIRFLNAGKGSYQSCIIVSVDSNIKNIEDLKGKKIAFGSADSTSSHLMPRSMLAEKGVPFDSIQAEYLGNHTNVAQAISMEQFAAGGVTLSVGKKFSEKGDVRILAESPMIPEFPICVNKHLDAALKEKIEAALLKLNIDNPEHKKILTAINPKYTGCEPAKDSDYDVIRTVIKNVYGDDFYKKN